MSDIREAHGRLIHRILEGQAKTSPSDRRAAFDNNGLSEPQRALVEKVVRQAHTLTAEDLSAVLASGITEDELFELIVCAAVGAAARQYGAAAAALDRATGRSGNAPANS